MRKLHSNQELAAIKALSPTAELRYRAPAQGGDGTWYVHVPYVEVGDGRFLQSLNQAGKTSVAAINECFRQLTQLPKGHCIVLYAYDPTRRREMFWNDFMWADRVKGD